MDYYRAFPFYMGYQGYGQWAQQGYVPEDRILEDLEYLQQMYPTYAKKYQRVISDAVDKVDYEGSFIYDQYPDKITLQRMISSIMVVIKNNEEKESNNTNTVDMQKPINIQGDKMPMENPTDSNMPARNIANPSMPMFNNMPIMNNNIPAINMPSREGTENNPAPDNSSIDINRMNGSTPSSMITGAERAPWSEKEPWIRELVTVLMYYEILARRRRKTKLWNNFPIQ